MPEMKNPKHPSPHMINIPCWDYQHLWFVCTGFQHIEHSAEQLLPWHQSLALPQPEEQQLQSFIQKADVRRVHEETAHSLWPHRQQCSVTLKCSAGITELRRSQPVPNSKRALEQQHVAFETPSPGTSVPQCCAISPTPGQDNVGDPSSSSSYPSVAISPALLWRDVWNSNLTTLRSWMGCTPWVPKFRRSWHNARINLGYF